ncbi:MAG: DHH family phosphoesterase [Candidatus Saccharimonadales bacterium]
MKEQSTKLKKLIESSERILITSHIGSDGDSVSSSLLLYAILRLSYPNKQISVSMEEEPQGLSFLPGLDEVSFGGLADTLNDLKPTLVIILDANNINRVSRQPQIVRDALRALKTKVVIIDHHEPENIESNDLYVNNSSPAVTLDIYEIFIQELGYRKPENYAQIAATGIYTDTGGFINRNPNFQRTFDVIPKLIEDGANLEVISSNINKIDDEGFAVLRELIDNTQFESDYTYSFISDETVAPGNNLEAIHQAADVFRSQFLRNIDGRSWGFIVYKDILAPASTYSVSFRAISGTKDVAQIALKLGGGGHKPAAGAKFVAYSVQEAIDKVKQAITEAGQ